MRLTRYLAALVLTAAQVAVCGCFGSSSREVDTTAGPGAEAGDGLAKVPHEFRVYAGRVGLVGGKTANGHQIVERDHFAALPSRKGLSPQDSGERTVQVCAKNGRCAWVPVWDLGPWNTKDDYWNARREVWVDLPQGKPQAEVAFYSGHNGGKDHLGRQVANPAGILLADGVFWDGLQLVDYDWVTVLFLWTSRGLVGTVNSPDAPLAVRSGTALTDPDVGVAAHQARLLVQCQAAGAKVLGPDGETDAWFRIATGMFVPKALVRTGEAAPPC